MIFRLLLSTLLISGLNVFATDLSDINDEAEDVANEADAAAAGVKEVKERISSEKADASRELQVVKAKRDKAVAARQDAAERLRKSEDEVQHLGSEQVRLKAEIVRLNKEAALHEKAIEENKLKITKAEAEVKTLQELRGESGKRFIELGIERDKVEAAAKALAAQKTDAEKDFQVTKAQEKAAKDSLDKLKAEYQVNKTRTEAYLAAMKERYNEAQDRINQFKVESLQTENEMQKLDAQAKTAETEVAQVESITANGLGGRTVSSTADNESGAAEQVVFKRSCRVYDLPTKNAQVLTTKTSGAVVAKADEGKKWIAFKLSDGRKGYVNKTCVN